MIEILLALISAMLAGGSIAVQKLGLDNLEKINVRYLLKSRNWLIGVSLSGLSVFIYVLSLNAGDVSIVQPVLSTSVMFTALFSRIVSREKITKFVFLSLILVNVGIALLATGV